MFRSSLLRRNRQAPSQSFSHRFLSHSSSRATTSAPPPPTPQSDRIQRILRRTPKFLRPTLSALHNAPLTHITAFLILHELTAVIPLFGLVAAFHYFQWLPPFFAEGKWVVVGVEKFGNYFRRKGWIDAGDKKGAEKWVESRDAETAEMKRSKARIAQMMDRIRGEQDETKPQRRGIFSKWWVRGESGTRLVVEFATAYAVVKVLLPLRLVVSVWGSPWFARWTVVPFSNMVKGFFRRPKSVGTGAAGTKACDGKNVTK
ncbi:hypothetical protein GJ744_001717 [Endocarpon pusillum]|uniref:Uncharacterized protein n=1 Tax=Endocarpon pusillum TaxID=364733 RepID=A0A8H7AC53_9EURO|nr:hypothetical protein GJ744_001717 [Endocarpon pusillum]